MNNAEYYTERQQFTDQIIRLFDKQDVNDSSIVNKTCDQLSALGWGVTLRGPFGGMDDVELWELPEVIEHNKNNSDVMRAMFWTLYRGTTKAGYDLSIPDYEFSYGRIGNTKSIYFYSPDEYQDERELFKSQLPLFRNSP